MKDNEKTKKNIGRTLKMAISKEELLDKLSECVLEMEDEEVVDVAEEYIEAGYPALDGIMEVEMYCMYMIWWILCRKKRRLREEMQRNM